MSRSYTPTRFAAACALMLCVMIVACYAGKPTPTPARESVSPLPTLPAPRPDGSCHVNGALPDKICTPGDIQQGVTRDTICAPSYTTRTVRPDVQYTNALKVQQLKEYGLALSTSDVEEDHLIPLELAGNPVSPLNLWPQSRHAGAGFSAGDKDLTENAARKAVCDGRLSLQDAQQSIAADWVALRGRLMNMGAFTLPNPNAPAPTEP